MVLNKDGGITVDFKPLEADQFRQSLQINWNNCIQTEGCIYTD